MLDALKRLIARKPAESEWTEVADWAARQQLGFKRVRDEGGGFVLDGALDGKPWRLEWGPSQRPYIQGHELRIRMELGLSPNLQMLVLTRSLSDALERQAFESYTESNQTLIDGNTPEEMRWIVMFPKANVVAAKAVRARFHFTGADVTDTERWVAGPLAEALERADQQLLAHQPPFVLMTLRGRVYLRLALDEPDTRAIAGVLALFQVAVPQAVRAAASAGEGAGADYRNSQSTAWQDLGPDADPRP